MKKKLLIVLLLMLGLFTLSGCTKKEVRQSALDFKNEYEALNDKEAKNGKKFKSLDISKYNPMVKTTDEDIANKIKNNETFYLYVGDPLCPWCRSGLQKFTDIAVKKEIKDIYYIDFWDDDHNEILRDLFEVKKNDKGKVTFEQTRVGNNAYYKILDAVKEFAQDYTITSEGETYNVGVKRIFGGDVFYFKDGKCVKYTSLRSDKLNDAFDELSEEVLKDQENKFNEIFNN